MPTWVKCHEYEDAGGIETAPILHINLDNVLYMTGDSTGTAIYFVGRNEDEDDVIKVHETPDEIVSATKGPQYLRSPK